MTMRKNGDPISVINTPGSVWTPSCDEDGTRLQGPDYTQRGGTVRKLDEEQPPYRKWRDGNKDMDDKTEPLRGMRTRVFEVRGNRAVEVVGKRQ